jgi:glucoamylase
VDEAGTERASGLTCNPSGWPPASKDGVGLAIDGRVWFTVGRGAVEEVFFPSPDRPRIAGVWLAITDKIGFMSDERADASHHVERPDEEIPLYRLSNRCRTDRYRIEKTIFADPDRDVLLQEVVFTSPSSAHDAISLHVHLAPRPSDEPGGDVAWLAEFEGWPMLFAQGGGISVALACSLPWATRKVGSSVAQAGRGDLEESRLATSVHDRADGENLILSGVIDQADTRERFVLALGFGEDPAGAARQAIASLKSDPRAIRDAYARGWRDWQATLDLPAFGPDSGRDLRRIGAAVLRTHMGGRDAGPVVASLSTPWGEAQTPESPTYRGGYHLVWPRDQVEVANGLLSVGVGREARLILDDLKATQRPDGHWPQNMWCGGSHYWDGVQLGETALPILLCDRLAREGILTPEDARGFWPMIRRAASYIVRRGPSTQEDRWENQPGYTPFTLAAVIAALLSAAEMADGASEGHVAAYLRETADDWAASIDDWLYVEGTELARRSGVDGHYIRIAPCDWADKASTATGRLDPSSVPTNGSGIPATEVVSPDVLAFVRFGILAPDDPRIVSTVKVIDDILRVELPGGPCWRRYTRDGYGEHDDGTPYVKRDGKTRGRAWPLLTGERAHYELASGRLEEAVQLLNAMGSFAGESGMIPEQVWDAGDIPARGLFRGRPTGSAMPLAWAHAEYLTLCRSIALGRPVDRPPQPLRRYSGLRPDSRFFAWRTDHRRRLVPAGKILRILVNVPAVVRCESDDWPSPVREVATRDTTLGVHLVDLPIQELPAGTAVRFKIGGFEDELFEIKIVEAPRSARG